MSTMILVRPGNTDFDDQQRIQGILDLPLNARGEQQVQQMLSELRHVALYRIYTSPCEPAHSTALRMGAELGVAVKELDELQNINHGLWQGLQIDELRRKQPKVYKQWQESPETICPPEGEAFSDAVERVRRALERPRKKKGAVAIVAPEPLATVIRCVMRGCKLESLPPAGVAAPEKMWEVLADGTAPGADPNASGVNGTGPNSSGIFSIPSLAEANSH